MAVFARRYHFFLTSFSVSLLCNWVLCVLSLPKQIRKFHTIQRFMILWPWIIFLITSQTSVKAVLCVSSRSSYPFLLSAFALRQWVGLVWYCLRQLLWKLASHAKKSKPRILCKSFLSFLFSAVSRTDIQTLPWLQLSKHFSLWSPYVPLYYRRYCQVSKSLSEKLWKNAQKF